MEVEDPPEREKGGVQDLHGTCKLSGGLALYI